MSYPVVDLKAAAALGAALRRAGYTEDSILDMLGDDAYGSELSDLPVDERRLKPTRAGIAIRLLFLELPVKREEAVGAFGERGVDALVKLGLAEPGEVVRVHSRILPVGEILVMSDDRPPEDGND